MVDVACPVNIVLIVSLIVFDVMMVVVVLLVGSAVGTMDIQRSLVFKTPGFCSIPAKVMIQ